MFNSQFRRSNSGRWPDANDIISKLASQPERLVEISRRNAMEVLRRRNRKYGASPKQVLAFARML
jgi:hypothetical protein